jgi:hypothetical protein
MRLLAKLSGALLSAFAVAGCVFSVLALLDPRGTQHANDSDPFGTPPTTGESLLYLAVWLLVLGLGLWLSFRPRSR